LLGNWLRKSQVSLLNLVAQRYQQVFVLGFVATVSRYAQPLWITFTCVQALQAVFCPAQLPAYPIALINAL
jgi:hypothetical protein